MNTQTILNPDKVQVTVFQNLFNAYCKEVEGRYTEFVNGMNDKTVEQLTLPYSEYANLLPASRKRYKWELTELRQYLADRRSKADDKKIAKKLAHLQEIERSEDLESITVSVEWKKSRMWGNNPQADARVCDKQYGHNFLSSRVSGCGYDKESTAIAEAINQSNSFLKALYQVKEQNPNAKNGELFGYGSGYGIFPRLEGGVGVSCYPRIFDKIGFEWKTTASGKTFDVYTVTKRAKNN